jgi:protocatechuate 3,4-dioxygenase, beta subunit
MLNKSNTSDELRLKSPDLRLSQIDRRRFITQMASGLFVSTIAAEVFAQGKTVAPNTEKTVMGTPWLTEGPFYPYGKLPLDKDNDLVVVGNRSQFAKGVVTHIAGRVLDLKGNPINSAQIEIWQTDANGVYLAQGGSDPNFQGWGKFLTNTKGEYRFRTIKPVIYPGRTPHIHFRISAPGGKGLTTQLFIKGHPSNARDGVLGGIQSVAGQALVVRDFAPLTGSVTGECNVLFDIILGATPQEEGHGNFGGPPPPDGRGGRGRRGGGPPLGGFWGR